MPDEIKPAFTPDEWKDLLFRGVTLRPFLDDIIGAAADDLFAAMATANWSLPDDDPRKITREDVKMLDDAASAVLGEAVFTGSRAAFEETISAKLDALATKLAAFLPPGP